jgi:hypothetical protein
MVAKEFKRLFDKFRITMLNGAKLPTLPEYLTIMEDVEIYDKHYVYFGKSCDRFIRQKGKQIDIN